MQFNCVKKNCTKNWPECSLARNRFLIRFVSFFVNSVCLLVRVTMVDKNKAVVCCLLATSAVILFEKRKGTRKLWHKKWYLKRNTSCDVHLLNELPEKDVTWDGAIVVSAGKLRKLWDSLSELSVLWAKDDWKGQFWGLHYCLSKLCSLLSFLSSTTSHSKIAHFNWECIGRSTLWPWSWTFTVQHNIYVKCEYFMNQEG